MQKCLGLVAPAHEQISTEPEPWLPGLLATAGPSTEQNMNGKAITPNKAFEGPAVEHFLRSKRGARTYSDLNAEKNTESFEIRLQWLTT